MWTLAAIALVWLVVGRFFMGGAGCAGPHRLSFEERRQLREMRRERRWRRRHRWSEADDAAWEGRGRRQASAPEDPVKQLQRLWVSGRITDDEYEQGLDALYAGSLRLIRD